MCKQIRAPPAGTCFKSELYEDGFSLSSVVHDSLNTTLMDEAALVMTQLCSNNQLYKAALRASTTHANLMRHNACTTQPLCVQQAKLAPCAQANRRQDTQRRMRGMHTASTSVKSAFAAHMLATTTCAPDLYYVCHSLASVQATPGHSIKSVRHLVLQALQHLTPSAPTWPILVLSTALLAALVQ